jgi:2-polyprenyl-6-methoxyphenol hydroxylase-like FAD-dependent oxidoreductase
MNTTPDITIVGWGPVGKALAIWLLEKGHRVAVVERWPQDFPLPRAIAYDHEVGRLLQSLGVADEAERFSSVPGSYEWRNAAGDVLQRFDWIGMGLCGWPAMSCFSQPDLEAALEARALSFENLTLHRGWQVDAVAVDAQGVETRATSRRAESGSPLLLRSRYVVGCDGANSFVRQVMDSQLHDMGFEADWLVVDAIPNDPARWTNEVWQLCDPKRPTTVVSGGPSRRRWEFMLLPGETKEAMNHREVAWQLLQPWDYTPANSTLERHAVYTFRGAVADHWRRGRLMIAGDAAHQMPPFAAQGLCAGLRDAASLAWRLDLILRGLAGDALLASYGSERLPHVQQIIGFAIELGKIICVTDAAAAEARDAQMLAMREDPSLGPPPPPPPRLGPGLLLLDDPHAGHVGLQGRVARQGRRGRFDDVVGRGFMLIATVGDPGPFVSPERLAFFERIGGRVVQVGGEQVDDLDGAYAAWLGSMNTQVVLWRPDFHIFGTAATLAGADELVAALQAQLTATHQQEFAHAR